MGLSYEAEAYIQDHAAETIELLKELARIPSPSGHEEKRIAFCKEWLHKNGVTHAYVDDAQNILIPFGNCENGAPITAFVAHSDVVFPDTEPLPQRVEGDRLYTPGVGDDTMHVAHMLMAARYITQAGLKPTNSGVLLAIDKGEEGLGNLRGCRKIIETFGAGMQAFFSLDSKGGSIFTKSIGCKRYRVEVKTEGGHSYSGFGNRNAIVYLASIINTLCQIKVPEGEDKVTYNIGTIRGGTSVNTIPQQAEMLYEFRSASSPMLDMMDEHFKAVIACYQTKGIQVITELVGERPCANNVDAEKQAALVARASEAVRRYFDVEIKLVSGSTDCNIPLSVGIPAISTGCYAGEGAHTRDEYILLSSVCPSQKTAFDLILGYFES